MLLFSPGQVSQNINLNNVYLFRKDYFAERILRLLKAFLFKKIGMIGDWIIWNKMW